MPTAWIFIIFIRSEKKISTETRYLCGLLNFNNKLGYLSKFVMESCYYLHLLDNCSHFDCNIYIATALLFKGNKKASILTMNMAHKAIAYIYENKTITN